MSKAPASVNIPKKPAERRGWVKWQFEIRGLSLREFARREGVSHQAVSHALISGNSAHLQEAIARELGLAPHQLFPELYDDEGNRLGRTREKQRSTGRVVRNVQSGEAA